MPEISRYDSQTQSTAVVNHPVYDAYGNVTSETNSALESLFLLAGRPFDSATGLQNNLNRWYDPAVGRWLSPEPLGLAAGDVNLYRYVGNSPIERKDPNGLSPWVGIARILGKRWGAKTRERAAKALAAELLEKLKNYRPDHPKAQEIIRELKKMAWIQESLKRGTHALAGKTVTVGGTAMSGLGGATAVGGGVIVAGAAGYGVGYGIGRISIGGRTIHEHLGARIYWIAHGISAGASAAWNWITQW